MNVSSTSYVCATCGLDRGSIFPATQECPPCRATRLGHCLCRSDMRHTGQCMEPADLTQDDGYCVPCRNFWESIANDG